MRSEDSIDWSQMMARTIALHPEKFAVMGSFSRDAMEMEVVPGTAATHFANSLMVRLSTSVLCGRTISENPQVKLQLPATWYQHLKYAAFQWRLDFSSEAAGRLNTAWLWVVARTLFLLLDKYMVKRPVKWTEVTADVHFDQHILYPDMDMPAHAGRPVIYEAMDVNFGYTPFGSNLSSGPSRFMDRHQIASEIYRDDSQPAGPWGSSGSMSPHYMLDWLERHGVNVDQMVKRQ